MKKFIELIKVYPLPWDYIFFILNLKAMMSIGNNKNLDIVIKVLVAFVGTLTMLEFLVPRIVQFPIIDVLNGMQVFLFFVYMVLPFGVIYSVVVYAIIYRKSSNINNLFALFIQIVKFFTIALVIIGLIVAIGVDSILVNNLNIFNNQKAFNNSSSYVYLVWLLILLCLSFIALVLLPTKKFLIENDVKFYKRYLFIIVIIVSFLNNYIYSLNIFPKIEISRLINKQKFCFEIAELKLMQNDLCETDKQKILQFRTNCEEILVNTSN